MPCEIAAPAPKRARTAPAQSRTAAKNSNFRPSHHRSFTNPEVIPYSAALSFTENDASNFLCSPMSYAPEPPVEQTRRASSCNLDNVAIEKYGFPTYRQMPTYVPSR